jgi:hypothetical protein
MNKSMKWIIVALFGALSGACYVPMPSVGIKPTRVHHEEVCTHTSDGKLKCTHTRRYVK